MGDGSPQTDLLFDVETPLGFRVEVTRSRWRTISAIKHPIMAGREEQVRRALQEPDQVRQSRSDPLVFLFYRLQRPGRWICAVAKCLDGTGFLITAYPTDAVKEGIQVWPR